MIRHTIGAVSVFLLLTGGPAVAGTPALRVGTFDVDATPSIGSPVAYALTRSIIEPLHARGIVLLPAGQKPIVLCSVDWIGIGNDGQHVWCEALAKAAKTTQDRVAVHSIHQHDGPRCDFSAVALFADPKQAAAHFDVDFANRVIRDAASAVEKAVKHAQTVTDIGAGKAKGDKVASNRRILGPDGKVAIVRYSSCRDPKGIAAPEGTIDPYLRLVSFWNGDKPLVCLMYYASHPMSYYGKGDVSPDFVGLARERRDKETGVMHVYFTGAGGNVAAGKYNDGSPKMRPILAKRMENAMHKAWDATRKTPISAADIEWRVEPVRLPVTKNWDAAKCQATLDSDTASDKARLAAASNLAWIQHATSGKPILLSSLRLGPVYLVQMPGELFVEYQLAAVKMRPDKLVCMAAYGDYGPGYIGMEAAYDRGGYETSPRASGVAPEVERVLMPALKRLLAK